MKKLLTLLAIVLSINSYAQINFEQGYFIDNSGQKTECLIKNTDWKNNPTKFDYKLSENSKTEQQTIQTVKEFGIYNDSKYISAKVKIDRSSPKIQEMGYEMKPIFNEEELFLKVVLEGKANLFFYEAGDLIRYFYNIDNTEIEQLVFKYYKKTTKIIRQNNQFQQQLWNNMKCSKINMNDTAKLKYQKGDLLKFFTKYNQCHNSEITTPKEKEKKDLFNLNLRPHLRYTSFETKDEGFSLFWSNADFGSKFSFGFGLESEFILPFNNNKWSIILEPTFQHYSANTRTELINNISDFVESSITYNSIEIPLGLRYYIFLNDKTSIFVNSAIVFDLSFNSSITYQLEGDQVIDTFKLRPGVNIAMGTGVKMNNRYSVELRYLTNRELLTDISPIKSKFSTFEVILGYTLF